MKKKKKTSSKKVVKKAIEEVAFEYKSLLKAWEDTFKDWKPRKKTKAEIKQEQEEARKKKKAKKILDQIKPLYARVEKMIGSYDAKELLHDTLDISCDCYHENW